MVAEIDACIVLPTMYKFCHSNLFFVHQVEQMVQHTEATLGPVDILVNNAGVMYYTKMTNLMKDDWERQIDINCKVEYWYGQGHSQGLSGLSFGQAVCWIFYFFFRQAKISINYYLFFLFWTKNIFSLHTTF